MILRWEDREGKKKFYNLNLSSKRIGQCQSYFIQKLMSENRIRSWIKIPNGISKNGMLVHTSMNLRIFKLRVISLHGLFRTFRLTFKTDEEKEYVQQKSDITKHI